MFAHDLAGHGGVGRRIGALQEALQAVPLSRLVVGGVLVADRLDLHRLGQMLRGQAHVHRDRRGDLCRTGRRCGRGSEGESTPKDDGDQDRDKQEESQECP